MRQGFFPGQQDRLFDLARKGLRHEELIRRDRRRFVVLLVGSVAAAATGAFALGRSWGPASPAPTGPRRVDRAEFLAARLGMAHRLAAASDAELLDANATFLVILAGTGGDARTWHGFGRLANLALVRNDAELARALLQVVAVVPPPPEHTAVVERLRSLR